MKTPVIALASALAALVLLAGPVAAQETDASVELPSGNSDCVNRSQTTDGTIRQLIRCVSNGIRQFALGFCFYGDTGMVEPCWAYIDCDSVKHYAGCVADVARTGFQPALPPCDACPHPVGIEVESWGQIKARCRDGQDR